MKAIPGILATVILARSARLRLMCAPRPALYRLSSWNYLLLQRKN